MKTLINLPKSLRGSFSKGFILSFVSLMLYGSPAVAEEEAANTTIKAVLTEVKTELKYSEMMTTMIMIGAVIIIVGVAMYLSFKTPTKSLK